MKVTPILARIIVDGGITHCGIPTKIENVGMWNYSSHILHAYVRSHDFICVTGGNYRVEFYVPYGYDGGTILIHFDEFYGKLIEPVQS